MRVVVAFTLVGLGACSVRENPGVPIDSPTSVVQPLGDIASGYADSASAALAREHGAMVYVLSARELPQHAFARIRSPRYRADTLIAWLRSIKPDSVDLILGLTAHDISITKRNADGSIKDPEWKYRDFGIFGLGYIGGPSCVVSTHRLGDGRSSQSSVG